MSKRAQKERKEQKGSGNQRRVIKRLALEAIVIMVICAILGGVAHFLLGVAEEEKKKSDQSETEVLQLSGQAETLRGQMEQFKDALPLSKKILDESGESTLTLGRDLASAVFVALRDVYVLKDVKVNISPIELIEDQKFNKNHIQAIRSTIRIEMSAFNDEDVVAYVQDVVSQLPGLVSVQSIRMTRGKEYTLGDDAADENTTFNEPQVKAIIDFVWYGFSVKHKEGE